MKLILQFVAVSLLLVNNVESRWIPKPGITWSYGIGGISDSQKLNRPEAVITLDFQNSANLISQLHNKGKRVICYFSGGTIEPHRKDKNDYYNIPGLVVKGKTEWDENWLDFRNYKNQLYPLIKRRMIQSLEKNCDALEVDNLGAYHYPYLTTNFSGKGGPYTKDDSFRFAKDLASMAHEIGISIGLKNLAGLAPSLVNDFDFAVVESCSESPNICAKFKDFPKQGKAVFSVHYGNRGSFSSQVKTMVREQKGFGYTCVFANHQNLKTPTYPFNCDTGSTSSTSGSVPNVQNSPNNNTPVNTGGNIGNVGTGNRGVSNVGGVGGAGSTGTAGTAVGVGVGANSNNTSKPGVGGVNASGVAGAAGAAGSNGLQTSQNGAVNPGVANASGIPGNSTASDLNPSGTILNPVATEIGAASNTPGTQDNISINNKNVEDDSGSSSGKIIAFIAIGGVALSAIAFFLIKRRKKSNSSNYDYYY